MTTRILGAVALIAFTSCISVQVSRRPEEAPTRTPNEFVTVEEPVQEPTGVDGLFRAPNIDKNLFYYAPDKAWYRWAYDQWFQAFRWDGKWYAIPEKDMPKPILTVEIDRAPERSLKDKLREQERALKEIDRKRRLEELEEKMKAIEKNEKQGASKDE